MGSPHGDRIGLPEFEDEMSEETLHDGAGKVLERVRLLAGNRRIYEDVIASLSADDVLEAFPDGVVVANEAGVIIYANRSLALMFRYQQNTLCGQPIEILIPLEKRELHGQQRKLYGERPTPRMMGANRTLLGNNIVPNSPA